MVRVDKKRCTGCSLCMRDCPNHAIRLAEGKAEARPDCLLCGHCVAVCPAGAVSIPEFDMADVEPCSGKPPVEAQALLRLIKSRRSVRHFTGEKLSPAEQGALFQAGRYTATAKNNQDSIFVLVQEQKAELERLVWEQIERLAPQWREDETRRQFVLFLRQVQHDPRDNVLFRDAPAVLFISSLWPLDAGLAAQNIELTAAALGLGVQYNGYLQRVVDDAPKIKAWLGLEDRPVKACMLLGHPDVGYVRTAPRKPAQVIVK